MHLSRRHLLGLLGLLANGSCNTPVGRRGLSAFQEAVRRPAADKLRSIPLPDVRLGGYLGRKLDLCIRNRIMAQDPEQLVEPFRHREERQCWQTEFWGKWFLSAVDACAYTGESAWRERLGHSVRAMLGTQSADGYIGNYANGSHLKAWDIWGRKYTLLGLLAWYDLTADPAALDGARRLADHLMTEVGPEQADIVRCGFYRGMASSSVIEPVVRLFRRTHSDRFLQFAGYIVSRWSASGGPQLVEKALAGVPVAERFPPPRKWWSWENGQKAYEMMSCYTGLLEWYRETGAPDDLRAALLAGENIRNMEINIAGSGSSEECWYRGKARQTQPARNTMETCVTTSWMQLCYHLLRLTGDSRFADEIEKTAYNSLLGALTPDGSSFAKYSSLEGVRQFGPPQCGMGLNCCTANGPRGMMLLPETAVMMSAEGPVVNLYSEGTWSLALTSGTAVRLQQTTGYPSTGEIGITVAPERAQTFPLRLRVPAWSTETVLKVNGSPVKAVEPGAYALAERRWRPGDRVHLRLDMRGRLLRASDDKGQYVAVMRGPLALARDSRLGQRSVDEPIPALSGENGYVPLRSVAAPDEILAAFRIGGVDPEILLCDYASAGNSWDERSRFRVWMPLKTV